MSPERELLKRLRGKTQRTEKAMSGVNAPKEILPLLREGAGWRGAPVTFLRRAECNFGFCPHTSLCKDGCASPHRVDVGKVQQSVRSGGRGV